jgi:hypothetical protein
MDKERLDARTVDRILSGKMEPGEGGAGVAALTNLLRAAAAPAGTAAEPRADLLAAMSVAVVAGAGSSVTAPRAKSSGRRRHRMRARVAAVAFALTLALGTGLAYAGALGPLQSAAAHVLHTFGLNVHAHHGGTAPSPVGPDVTGPAAVGLCNAYTSGQGGTNGGKDDSVAFQNLQNAATAAGQTVDEFCASVAPPGSEHSGSHKIGNDNGQGNGSGKDDNQGENEQGNGGNGGGNDQGTGGGGNDQGGSGGSGGGNDQGSGGGGNDQGGNSGSNSNG